MRFSQQHYIYPAQRAIFLRKKYRIRPIVKSQLLSTRGRRDKENVSRQGLPGLVYKLSVLPRRFFQSRLGQSREHVFVKRSISYMYMLIYLTAE